MPVGVHLEVNMDIQELISIATDHAEQVRQLRLIATGEVMSNKEKLFNQLGFEAGVKWAEQNQHKLSPHQEKGRG
jgi:hypothetical protein|tara:strand:- start:5240 stop:5464 length:225 start_codon:yes stop_codon:yes gene_type:complete